MAGGRIWGAMFFLFMTFAALTTIIAVFQNIYTYIYYLLRYRPVGMELKESHGH